jgi:hypothetical protein
MVECWNIGKMGLGILQYWVNGKIRPGDKASDRLYPFENPQFHYSILKWFQNLRSGSRARRRAD